MGAAGGELRAGFGREVISPPAGVGLAGYFAPRPNRGVLDDLHARAAVFRNGATAAGILSLDLITVTAALARAVRREVSALDAGLARNLLIAATHTHHAPSTIRVHGYGWRRRLLCNGIPKRPARRS